MKWFGKKTVDVIQWVLILGLTLMLVLQGIFYRRANEQLDKDIELNKENTYIRIYESKKLDKLKRENEELYDSISKLGNVENAMTIQFVERYKTDTIYADKFTVKHDSIFIYDKDGLTIIDDSTYLYREENDTVDISVDIKADKLHWVKADFNIRDKFMIVNREMGGVNQTTIHSSNATVDGTTMWHDKKSKKWYERFSVGPQVGVGYGTINNKPDVYVGVGVTYTLF